ncbi:hypothetical protein BDV34DRAFT_230561 [Aspergillus parasiticus]|uniref:Uncharacterized protein n=1 Tax=Aspergillus parasiticus TaxID=5067 RepID=A0A5N6D7R4_ASPPA|nr:hypothetical protein BDV34DRAFT_230561 [Aspergillus parasiticus]
MAVMYNNLVATDDTVLYCELLPILRIMLTQLWNPRFIHHMVSSVLIFFTHGTESPGD